MPTEEPLSDQDKLQVEEKKSESQRHFRGPKKHFVRKEGWLVAAQRRATKILQSGREHSVKYFTLCGREALDVLYLASHEILEFDGRGYPGVVFCEAEHDDLAHILRRLGRTAAYFPEYLDNFVLDEQNPYYEEFERTIPFDIFNLDFTGVCFPTRDAPYSRTLQAVRRIITLQSQAQADFDLFVTFRAERARENEDAILELKENMEENFRKYEEIRDMFVEKHSGTEELLSSDYGRFLLETFPKIIARYGNEENYRVACEDRYFYKRGYRDRFSGRRKTYQIVKFIFIFDFETPSVGILQPGRTRTEALTESYLETMRSTIRLGPTDVDAVLRANRAVIRDLKREVQQLVNGMQG